MFANCEISTSEVFVIYFSGLNPIFYAWFSFFVTNFNKVRSAQKKQPLLLDKVFGGLALNRPIASSVKILIYYFSALGRDSGRF